MPPDADDGAADGSLHQQVDQARAEPDETGSDGEPDRQADRGGGDPTRAPPGWRGPAAAQAPDLDRAQHRAGDQTSHDRPARRVQPDRPAR